MIGLIKTKKINRNTNLHINPHTYKIHTHTQNTQTHTQNTHIHTHTQNMLLLTHTLTKIHHTLKPVLCFFGLNIGISFHLNPLQFMAGNNNPFLVEFIPGM